MAREMAAAQARSASRPTPRVSRSRMNSSRRWIKRYRPNDISKRHRIQDDQPKTEAVSSYTRRT